MSHYILVKTSQVFTYLKTPLYLKNEKSGYVLYKADNKKLDKNQYVVDNHPDLYIHEKDVQNAKNELRSELKKRLVDKIQTGKISEVKTAVCDIVVVSPASQLIEAVVDGGTRRIKRVLVVLEVIIGIAWIRRSIT